MGELKPCPFCGGAVESRLTYSGNRLARCASKWTSTAECAGAHWWHFANSWELRPIEDALRARVAELSTQLEASKLVVLEVCKINDENKARVAELEAERDGLERRNAHFVDVCLAIQNGDDDGPCFDLTPAELAAAEARRKDA